MATTYRYSTGTSSIGSASLFPWEYPVPDTAFWNPLGYKVGSTFLKCFNEQEIQTMTPDLDSRGSLAKKEKLEFLLGRLREKRSAGDEDAKGRGLSWREVEYDGWRLVLLSMATIQSSLGQKAEEEKLCRELAAGSEEKDSLKSQHYLSFILEERGYYAEAEKIACSLKPRIDKELGEASPQAVGCRKIIARAVWKLGRRAQAREMIREVFALIERMGGGKYAVYQAGNKIMLEGMVEELEAWRADV